MFGLGMPELVVIMVIALIIFGPKKLPEIGQAIGKGIREFREGADAMKKDVEVGIGLDEKTKKDLMSSLTMEEPKVEAAVNVETTAPEAQAVSVEKPATETQKV